MSTFVAPRITYLVFILADKSCEVKSSSIYVLLVQDHQE